MNDRIIEISVNISQYSVILPLLFSFYRFRQLPKFLKILGFIVLISAITDTIGLVNYKWIPIGGNFYYVSQFILLIFIFKEFFKKKWIHVVLITFLTGFCIISLYLILTEKNPQNSNPVLSLLSSIVITPISLYYLIHISITDIPTTLYKNPKFWLNAGVLIYFLGNLVVFSIENMYNFTEVYYFHYMIHNSLNILKNILFAIAFIVELYNHQNDGS